MIDVEETILAIYDVTSENLQEARKTMPVSREVYALYSRNYSYEADYFEIMTINKQDFPSAVYLLLLNRSIDKDTEEFLLSVKDKMPEKAFKHFVLRSVLLSEEYTIKTPIIRNCFILMDEEKSSFKGKIRKVLFFIWRRLPGSIKRIVMNVFRRLKT